MNHVAPEPETRIVALAVIVLCISLSTVGLMWLLGYAPDTRTHEVRIIDFAFEPPQVVVTAGDRVRWHSVAGLHTVVSDRSDWASDNLRGTPMLEQTFEQTFEQSGEHTYHCSLHNFMLGSVVVVPPDPLTTWLWRVAILTSLVAALSWLLMLQRMNRLS